MDGTKRDKQNMKEKTPELWSASVNIEINLRKIVWCDTDWRGSKVGFSFRIDTEEPSLSSLQIVDLLSGWPVWLLRNTLNLYQLCSPVWILVLPFQVSLLGPLTYFDLLRFQRQYFSRPVGFREGRSARTKHKNANEVEWDSHPRFQLEWQFQPQSTPRWGLLLLLTFLLLFSLRTWVALLQNLSVVLLFLFFS